MAVETQQARRERMTTSNDDEISSTTKPLRRACDCCRKRKVKCDGAEPCGPCKKASIRCAYLQPPKKKGPKGLRSARVLHALRRIDHNASVASPTSSLSPEQHGAFGNWGWHGQSMSPNGTSYTSQIPQQSPNGAYAPHTSVAPDQVYYQSATTTAGPTHPHQQYTSQPVQYKTESSTQIWPSQPDSISSRSDTGMSSTTHDRTYLRLPAECFLPYIQLFFSHMFPIMPIIDANIYLDTNLYTNSRILTSDMYCFLCSICAATIVQLDESIPQPTSLYANQRMDDVFADECLRERKNYDYIEVPHTLNVMTSFFLFAYYGNHEKQAKAWHYLQESITFAENLSMDDDNSYLKLEAVEAQWRRRLYWLLFITERAYAVQRRKQTRLHKNVEKPNLFSSEDPHLLNGFNNLATLFSAVDDNFVLAWRGFRKQSLCNEDWLAETQRQLDAAALALDHNISETQHMDISITREWLHVLAWQMGVSNGLIWGKGEGGMRLDYPIELARKVIEITSTASPIALDSHGIGMEQKLSDIAGCVADVLRCTAGDTSATFLEGKQYLNILLQKLSSMRGKESRYLKPLMAKMEGLMGYELDNQTLPLPTESAASYQPPLPSYYARQLSMADSVNMLRTLSMSGNLGMPSLAVPLEDWTQRRESGKILTDEEARAMDPWLMNGVTQAV